MSTKNDRHNKFDVSSRGGSLFAMRALRWLCPPVLYEEIEGDLLQRFHRECVTLGEKKATRRLTWNALHFLRPGVLLRREWTVSLTSFYMLSNYLMISLRIMRRNSVFTAINVLGLTLGMTGALLLGLWVARELSVDQFYDDADRIQIVWNRERKSDSDVACWSATPRVLAPTLASDFTAVEYAASFADYNDSYLFIAGEQRVMRNQGNFVDPEFLKILSFPLISGEVNSVLGNPNSIVLTESFAKLLFGGKNAFGETLTIAQGDYKFPFTVTGVLKDLPDNTDFHFDYLLPFSFIESNYGKEENWQNNSVVTLVKLKEGSSKALLNDQIRDLKKKNVKGEDTELFMYPLKRNHLYSRFENGVPAGGRIEIVRMIGLLAVILVVIACINFVNLSTARASRRTKEVAVRKVTGALRGSLIVQFLCESVLIAAMAGVISLVFAYFALPLFNSLTQQHLRIPWNSPAFWLYFGAAVITVGLLAGLYPSLLLSRLMPAKIMKGVWLGQGSRSRLRSALVVLQFGFALTLMVSLIVVYKQTRFLQQRSVGYDRNQLIYQYLTGTLTGNPYAYREALMATGAVASVTCTSSPVTQRMSSTSGIAWAGKDPSDKTVIERFAIDQHVSATLGVEILVGRDLDLQHYPADSSSALINEAAWKLMGFENPIGELISDSGREWRIAGVVKDFIFTSPYRRVEPIVMQGAAAGQNMTGVVHIRLVAGRSAREAIEAVAKVARTLNPEYPFEYHFVDQEYARKFSNEKSTLWITAVFSGLAIFIGCLGLLGLSTYMIEARIKEIGIRKVMGGSVIRIVRLLSMHTLRPILWSIVVFSPGAWWAMNWWLQSYEYRTAFFWWIIPAAALCLVLLALFTVVFQILRAARMNPVSTLRSE